jgi:hypothetical protein
MKPWFWTLNALALGCLAAGCGGAPATPPVVNKAAAAVQQPAAVTGAPVKPASPAVLPRIPDPGPPLSPLNYEAKGRRDPFAPVQVVVAQKTGLDVGAAKLVGVIQGDKLLALVETPDGLGYILKPGDVLGNGRVTDVSAGSVTFGVASRGAEKDTNVTLRLVKE